MSIQNFTPKDLTFTFDIGYSSIGWAVMSKSFSDVVIGCGTLLFLPEDCQNQSRRLHRSQRKNIAATRKRIKQMGELLHHTKCLTEEELSGPISPWPWLMAAQVLSCKKVLNWVEMWQVLRWYAHNRGYDGNKLWANEGSPEDNKRNEKANTKMREHNTN